jgi:ABC-type multidrug transport system fused ATPase/permease subunit
MKLTDNFRLSEFTNSQTAERQGIDNTPPPAVIEVLRKTAAHMEQVRALLGGNAIVISSGYRSPALNKSIGGAATSQHTKGEAVDFTCPAFGKPADIVKAIKASSIEYDQVILEFNRWVHISFTNKPRKQVLIIDRSGTRVFA